MRDLMIQVFFLFSNPKNTQGPSETFYNAVSDGLISLKIPQIPKVLPRHLETWGTFAKVSAFLIIAVKGINLPITNTEFLLDHGGTFSMPTRLYILPQVRVPPYRLR